MPNKKRNTSNPNFSLFTLESLKQKLELFTKDELISLIFIVCETANNFLSTIEQNKQLKTKNIPEIKSNSEIVPEKKYEIDASKLTSEVASKDKVESEIIPKLSMPIATITQDIKIISECQLEESNSKAILQKRNIPKNIGHLENEKPKKTRTLRSKKNTPIIDIFTIFNRDGKENLRNELNKLSEDDLRALIKLKRFAASGERLKKKDKDSLIAMIVNGTEKRSKEDLAFLTKN